MTRQHFRALAAFALPAAMLLSGAAQAADEKVPAAKLPTGAAIATPTIEGAPAAVKPTGPQPKAVFEETTFNAGDVPKGEPISHDFVVKNDGKADLMILAVKPACGCTAPDWTKVIAPGQSGKVSLKIDTARFKGPISKTANVTTNDAEASNVRLTVNAEVKTYIDVLPSEMATFRHYRGEEKKETLTIHSNEKGDFKINDVKVEGEGIKHSLVKAEDGTGDYKLDLWLDKSAPIGTLAGSVKLLTNSAKEPEANITVRGTVLGQLSVNPSTLYFRIGGDAEGGGAKVVVPNTDGLNVRERGELNAKVVSKVSKDTKLTVVEETDEWMKVRTDAGLEGWTYKKLVSAAPTAAGAEASQSKVLNVTHREEAAFQITGTAIEGQKFDAKNLKIQTEPVKEGQSYRLTVTYTGGLDKGNYTGTLVVKTNTKEEPEIKVPVYIIVA
jgi:hypothetical protein